MKIDVTKYTDMVANAAAQVKISSTIFKNFIADVKAVIDGNDDLRIAHVAETASHGATATATANRIAMFNSGARIEAESIGVYRGVKQGQINVTANTPYELIDIFPESLFNRGAYILLLSAPLTTAGAVGIYAIGASEYTTGRTINPLLEIPKFSTSDKFTITYPGSKRITIEYAYTISLRYTIAYLGV